MWMWILGFLFIALGWAAWFFLHGESGTETSPAVPDIIPIWVPIVITVVILSLLIGIVIYRRVRAARAARALEKAIAQQAQEQVMAAKPEQRAEVIELQRQMLDGIKALKASRLGDGKGSNALYALPWYAIVGPPGAGKTTALRHSGLSFPFLDQTGGGVRGVGGTRNCDWWFTNDAILLDTAGRYTTEQDDRDEWFAFLNMLRTYRKHKPLNGVMVAVSVSDLLDASDEEIQQVASRVRDRIDEMQSELKMILPVYVMFTKTDLVAGFVEFFEDMKRSERGQPFGSTFALSLDKSEPGKLFEREFDTLVGNAHERAIRRLAIGRGSKREREKVYQFPLEFAALKQNLADFMAAAFRPTPAPTGKKTRQYQIPDPILRGFYFTSGTQEGKPLDRVVGAMGRAFGLRPVDREEAKPTEGKSYFLKDVFTNIIFADKDLAARTEDEVKRVRWQRVLIAAAAIAVAMLLAVPAVFSFANNAALVAETKNVSDSVKDVKWDDSTVPAEDKIDKLDALVSHVKKLDDLDDATPIGYRWGMFQGGKLFEAAVAQYVQALRDGFILQVKRSLEQRLDRKLGGETYTDDFNRLKTYLLLDDGKVLGSAEVYARRAQNDEFMRQELKTAWADSLQEAGSSDPKFLARLAEHVDYYVKLMSRLDLGTGEREYVKGEELDAGLVDRARKQLASVPIRKRYYDIFVDQVNRLKDDEDKLVYPTVSLESLFADRPGVVITQTSPAGVIGSVAYKSGKGFHTLPGAFTFEGYRAMIGILNGGVDVVQREFWVVPLGDDEKAAEAKIKLALQEIRLDYEDQYILEWQKFLDDIYVVRPESNERAVKVYRTLATAEWPYQRIIRAVKENTQFENEQKKKEEEKKKGQGFLDQAREKARRAVMKMTKGIDPEKFFSSEAERQRPNPIPKRFESLVTFALPEPPKPDEPAPASQLSGYIAQLEGLAGEMQVMLDTDPPSPGTKKVREMFEGAVKDAEKRALAIENTRHQEIMRTLLLDPLYYTHKAVVRSAGQAASGLWDVLVWPDYRDKIRNRYPFNALAKRDASFEDAKKFFAPKEGTLWGFYDAYLKDFHVQNKHKFVPANALQKKTEKRFTPFNGNLYHCLERADEITEALFQGAAEPKVEFEINVRNVSPIVSEIAFELDGQKKIYQNEKEFWKGFDWPGPEAGAGASIRIRGAGGLDEEIKREGPWGLFRLFEVGTITAKQDDDSIFEVSWQTAAPPVTVTIQVRPKLAAHPFPLGFFRDTNCPANIGDTFAPPAGG